MTEIKDKAVSLVYYYAWCDECNWKGNEWPHKSTARNDKRAHNKECH